MATLVKNNDKTDPPLERQTQICAKVDDKILLLFRDIIYERYGLKKGDFKKALEGAMLDYVEKHANDYTNLPH